MRILHLGYMEDTFHLWAETAVEGIELPPAPDETAHPFAVSHETLQSILQQISTEPSLNIREETAGYLLYRLPSSQGKPSPSSRLLLASDTLDAEPDGVRFAFQPWHVPVLVLSYPVLRFLLTESLNKTLFYPGVLSGPDLAFWAQVFRLAQSLVIREQFYPDFDPDAKQALWKARLQGLDREAFQTLLAGMPCVALASPLETASLAGQLASALDCLVDATIRHSLAEDALEPVSRRSVELEAMGLHDRWLRALSTPHNRVQLLHHEGKQLRKNIRIWQAALSSTTAPFRLCFRLEEPVLPEDTLDVLDSVIAKETGIVQNEPRFQTPGQRQALLKDTETPWTLRYLFQSTQDPSLQLPVEELWVSDSPLLKPIQKQAPGFNVREHLLLSFGQVAQLYPALESSLQSAQPWGMTLDTKATFEFLTGAAIGLQQAGFGVMLPGWWNPKNKRQRLSMFAKVRDKQAQSKFAGSTLNTEGLMQFDWQVALGEERLTRRELETLAQLKTPMVHMRNRWVMVDPKELKAVLKFWQQAPSGEVSAQELVKMSLGLSSQNLPVRLGGVQAEGWLGEILTQLHDNTGFEEVPIPSQFQGTLRPYQHRGYSWMAFLKQLGLGACLADDMGLGKTVQTLALVQSDWETGSHNRKPVLLVCPTSVIHNWYKEAEKFTPTLPVHVYHGPERLKGQAFQKEVTNQGLVVSSYALLHRDFKLLSQVAWGGIILDEAQNIKNAETRQAKAARSLRADYRIALTGTPVENNVGDLWSIMDYLNPGFLGSQTAFKENFFTPIQVYRDPEVTDQLKTLTKPFILRRLKTDKSVISDLPDKQETTTYCTLTREQVSLYEATVQDLARKLETAVGIERRGLVLASLAKLKQICNHPAQFLGDKSGIVLSGGAQARSGKLTRLTEMIEEILDSGERALIFTQFAEMGHILQPYLQAMFGREVLFLHGGVPKKHRDRMVERFQTEAGPQAPPIFILSLKAGGTGITLTRANHVFHFDRWWNPAVENQATDRAFRIGQHKAVQVYKFVCSGTLEEKIDAMIRDKSSLAGQIVGSGEGWLTELSSGDLKNLLALSHELTQEGMDDDPAPTQGNGTKRGKEALTV